ncbi:MAG: double-cubane-cluster-containing anaerobic reductase [Treponema sp.]
MNKEKFLLPKAFEEFSEARRAGFIKMKNLKETGAKVVGVYCTYTPLEIIYAAGLVPVSLCSSSNDAIRHAEIDLPKNLCPLIKASYGVAVSDTCPYFYFADLIVGETTCDGKKKMYELMGKVKDTYILHLPQNYTDDASFKLWLNELYKFKSELEKRFGVSITEEKLRQAIRIGNIERENLKKFFELGRLNPIPLSGADMSAIQEGFGFNFEREKRNVDLKLKTAEIYEKWEKELKGTTSKRPRILITGCPVIGVREKILKTIEKAGGDIVVYENCSGVREKMELIDENIEPMEAIARKYLNVCCSVMSPNPKRFSELDSLIDEYEVDGVIEIVLQACHTFAIEATSVHKFVSEKKGKPYMYIESDYSMEDSGQVSTRIEAFMEIL